MDVSVRNKEQEKPESLKELELLIYTFKLQIAP